MNGNDERSIVSVDADTISGGCRAQGNNVASGLNSTSSTIKIDSLCIKLGIVKEKGDVQKCRHFSIRGYVAEMREKGRSNLLPFTHEQLPPIEVPQFRYWLCQRCVQNCGTANTSHETALTSFCDQIIVRPCAKVSNPQLDCNRVAVLPFGEGPSGLKSVDGGNDDKSIPAALGADNGQSSQEISAKAVVFQEPTKFSSVDTNVDAEANVGVSGEKESSGLREFDDLENDSMVKETTTTLVDQQFQSCQHNDYSNGPPRRKARKVRLLKELLSGNTKNSQQKRENSAVRLGPRASPPSAASPQIKRKILHDHDQDQDQDQDQRSVDITTQGYIGKKAKPSKGNNVAKTSVVEHCRDSGSGEGGQETNKYQWQKHGTQRSSVLDKVGSDPVTAWRTIFSDMGRTDDQVTAGSGASRPTYDISKGRGTEPYSNLMAPPPPPPQSDKNLNSSKKISRNPLKSKFHGEDSRKMNLGGSRTKDSQTQSDMELGLGLSLNNDPQAQVLPSIMNRNPTQDHGRRTDFFMGESSIPHRVPPDLKSKEGYVHDVNNRHAPRPAILQEQWPPYTQLPYGSCSGHQKLDFSDPYKRNTGVRLYSDVMRPHNHERREKMFSVGRSDEREIVELMAKNQYERSLCEARTHRSAGGNNNSWIIPNPSSFPKVGLNDEMPCLHQEYLSMIRPSSSISNIPMMPTSENMGPTAMRNPAASLFHSDQLSSFAMFDAFSQCQKQQPSSGIWISNSGNQRHHDPCYHHASKNGNKKIPDTHIYPTTNMQVLEAFSPYRNGTNMSFSQEYAKCSDKDKGKSVMNLDLNVVAPNAVEEQNNPEYRNPYHPKEQRNELNPKHISSLDSSYSNEAIPAMQLLSLMDAGKSNHHPFMSGKKFTKPLSPCYNHCSSTVAGKTSPIANSCFPYSGMRPGLQKPIGSPSPNPTHFLSGPESSSLPSGRFRNDQDVNSRQVYHNKPQEEKSRNAYSPSLSHGYRREDAYVFPLPWHHANEDRNERVSRAFGPRIDPPGITTICTINQNPADFSTPGPENEYMIDYEDLKLRGESSYKRKPTSENQNGPKRQKRP